MGLRLPAAALALLAAGAVLLGPASVVHACQPFVPTKRIPVSQATEQDRQHVVASGPGYVDVVRRDPLPPDAVVFEGTASALETTPGPGDPAAGRLRARWTFTVQRVVRGPVGPEAVIIDHYAGSLCGSARYAFGARQRVVARRDPATGELRPLYGAFDVPSDPPSPARLLRAAGPAWFAPAVVLILLAPVAVVAVVLVAAGTYLRGKTFALRAREPELEATRSAARAAPPRPPERP